MDIDLVFFFLSLATASASPCCHCFCLFQADAQDGQGRQTWSDGRVYEGQFQNGRFSGTGKMVDLACFTW